jgi:Rrf2 family protein
MAEEPDHLATARELSDRYSLPPGRVAKVLQKLASAHIVDSTKGAHGGYRLAGPIGELSFLSLSEAVDGPFHFAACDRTDGGGCEHDNRCTVCGPVHKLGEHVAELLANVTIGEVLEEERVR